MKKEDLKQLRNKNDQELQEELKKARHELFQLKMEKITGKLKNLRSMFFKRKQITVIKTLLKEREMNP